DALAVLGEIIFAVAGSAVESKAGAVRSEWNKLNGNDVRETKYRRVLDVYIAPGSGFGGRAHDALSASDHFHPVVAEEVPRHVEHRARDGFGRRAITGRAGKEGVLR